MKNEATQAKKKGSQQPGRGARAAAAGYLPSFCQWLAGVVVTRQTLGTKRTLQRAAHKELSVASDLMRDLYETDPLVYFMCVMCLGGK